MRRRRPARVHGVLLVDKPAGQTSHDVVQAVRRTYRQREVGHTGTLDPAATGLLVVTLGQGTRIARFLESADKAYEGTVRLGIATTTDDAEGAPVRTAELDPHLDREAIVEAARSLEGSLELEVPAYSAIKVEGQRLYQKARRGEDFSPPRRRCRVDRFRVTGVELPDVDFECAVSKGTYVRSLAVALGARLELPAHLRRLRRTRVGPHRVERAVGVEALQGEPDELLDLGTALQHLAAAEISDVAAQRVTNGQRLNPADLRWLSRPPDPEEPFMLVSEAPAKRVTAVAYLISPWSERVLRPQEPALRYARVLPIPAPRVEREPRGSRSD